MPITLHTLATSHGDPTDCRFNSSTALQADDRIYLIDAGAPVNALLIRRQLPFHQIRAVFVTHMHEDHVGGLSGLIKSLVKYPLPGQRTDIFLPEAGGVAALKGWMTAMHRPWPESLLEVRDFIAGPVFKDDRIQVTAHPTRHLENEGQSFPSYAFRLELPGCSVVFAGDLKGDFSDFPYAAIGPGCDLCVCEATHYDPALAVPRLAALPIGRMIFTHIGNRWHGKGEADLKAILRLLPFPAEVAHDGDEFRLQD